MPTITTEAYTLGDVLKLEAEGLHSRDEIVVLAGQSVIVGEVLGHITVGTVPTTGTADAGNAGAVTCTTVTGGVDTKVGIYTLRCIKEVGNLGDFEVRDPDGNIIGIATVGTAFTHAQINLILNDVGGDAVLEDLYTITVPAGGLQYREINFSGIDGSSHAAGLSYAAYDASASGERTLAYTSGGTYEVKPGDVVTGATSSATATVVQAPVATNSWASGNATGTFIFQDQVGTFVGENLNVGANLNVCTVAGNSTATAATDLAGVAVVRDAEIVSERLTWPTGATAAQKAVAILELAALGIIVRTAG